MTSYDDTRNLIRPIAMLVGLAVLVAAVVWFLARGDDSNTQPQTTPSTNSSMSAKQVAPPTAPADGVTLPAGSEQLNGLPVKFPYTDLGAVALPVEVTKSLVGFDYKQAERVATTYAAPEDLETFKQRSVQGVAMWRQETGVPAQGDAPAPASYAATPIAYTVKKLGTDYYVVNVLAYMTLTTVKGNTNDTLYAGTHLVRWSDGDWKLVAGTDSELQQLRAEGQPEATAPDTPEYKQAGWIPLNGGVS